MANADTGFGPRIMPGETPVSRILASTSWRIFLTAWAVYSVHFATNVVREHYPAFSLADHFSLKVDEYVGFHSDIFVHRDGHAYINNNVAVSVLAAVPLLVFDPVLDWLERIRVRQADSSAATAGTSYRTDKPNRRAFFPLVRERGLDLRFGAATAITSLFLMAPLSALAVVLMFQALRRRGIAERRAIWLALLFAFGTPLFFRTAPLNQNTFLMYATFLAFYLMWLGHPKDAPLPARWRVAAGLLGGFAVAADYAGAVLLLGLYGYLLLGRLRSASWWQSFRESLAFVAGGVPPILFLLFTQWVMYGNPILPGQYWMPVVNYTDQGWRGFSWPAPDLFLRNLFDPAYGMFVFGPLLLVGLIPARWYAPDTLILPRAERRFVLLLSVAFLIFCAANQYARMQFNTGFRYLIPLVPLIYLAAVDHLHRLPTRWLAGLSVVAVLHSWVLAAVREPVVDSWRAFLQHGIQLPWLTVLRLTSPPNAPVVSWSMLPTLVLALTLLFVAGIWWAGARVNRRTAPQP